MSPALLLSCEAVSKAYGAQPLFAALSLGLSEGERVGLIGPNGSGKSTLLRILAGLEEPDQGTRSVRRGVRVGHVPQDPLLPADRTVEQVMEEALAPGGAPARSDRSPGNAPARPDRSPGNEPARPDRSPGNEPARSESPDPPAGVPAGGGAALDDLAAHRRVGSVLGRAGFADPQQLVSTLSGGWRKRLAIARELVRAPDVLLLDEPTNHLDLEGILWLEGLLASARHAYLVVSHDRNFLENVATRMIELNRAYPRGLFEAPGRYSDFLARRDEVLRNQAEYEATLANKVRREIAWLRQGPKARSTKAKARIAGAERLIHELDEVKARTAERTAGIDFTASGRKSKKLLVAKGLVKELGGRRVLDGVDLSLSPGQRLGLVGPNGSGKTTLLALLAGSLAPDAGTLERAPLLRVVRFEQDRGALDPAQPLRRALAPDGDQVLHRGAPLHVAGWARRFLFRPEQLDTPVGRLSGGEQARILIARLMLRPADLLLLDEPTNDLDIPTLEVLEESLAEFPGCMVLVTHDRLLLDQVSTRILALDGAGHAEPYADHAQWEAARKASRKGVRGAAGRGGSAAPGGAAKPRPEAGQSLGEPPSPQRSPRRLSYQERREWEGMEAAILAAEEVLAEREQAVADPAVATAPAALAARCQALEQSRAEVERLYARWAELEARQG
jgi:ATP-binding cassette subfamily F protein uup